MKQTFAWAFPLSDKEISQIWDTGTLTVDANVLLDLYRYHEATRNSLLSSLERFAGRLWLSWQAADEYLRNRRKVIVSSRTIFAQAADELGKLRGNLESSVNQLRGNRIIPASIADELASSIYPTLDKADEKINSAKEQYPDYLQHDPILARLADMFSGAVGNPINESELANLKNEADQRISAKIPPGFLDADKEGDRQYGDFLLWRQILLHLRDTQKPIILVTSERKEDWWEKDSQLTLGPRYELLREAQKYSDQRILMYQTDRFVQWSGKVTGSSVDDIVQEIREVEAFRSQQAVEVVDQNVLSASHSQPDDPDP